jgi:hypothetical protein
MIFIAEVAKVIAHSFMFSPLMPLPDRSLGMMIHHYLASRADLRHLYNDAAPVE